MSPAKDLGTKYTCWKCESKFYDLGKPVAVVPPVAEAETEAEEDEADPHESSDDQDDDF